ncbi:trypsin-like peptidase domain-containing protein [Pseudoxanthobacter sp. M-2]
MRRCVVTAIAALVFATGSGVAHGASTLATTSGAASANPTTHGSERALPGPLFTPINIIDGSDDRGSLLELGPGLGLSSAEIARIRRVSGFVGCLSNPPSMVSGMLFLTDRQVVTVAHVLFEPNGRPRSKCFFRTQDPEPFYTDLDLSSGAVRLGAKLPKAGSAEDFVVVRLMEPVPRAVPFPVAVSPARAGEALIVVTAHPAGMAREVDKGIPVVQGCTVRRVVPSASPSAPSQLRTDCDATGSSSGGMNMTRIGGQLMLRAITVATGPWRNKRLEGAPFNEKTGSQTVAIALDGPVLTAARALAASAP